MFQMLLTDALVANCWKEWAVLLREKAGLNVPESRQTAMKDKKTYFYKTLIVVCTEEIKLARKWNFTVACPKPYTLWY